MKRLFIITTLVVAICITGNAQKVAAAKIPAAVTAAFAKQYPGVSPTWEKEAGKFEASFIKNKNAVSVLLEANGVVAETETAMKEIDVPVPILAYLNKNYKGKTVKEYAKITTAAGTVTYEAEVNGKDVIFDAAGKFIKEVKE